jgi:hypothetical protein
VLAEVYRRARQMWPLGGGAGATATATAGATATGAAVAAAPAAAAAPSVTIRIDQIKELKIADIQSAFTQVPSRDLT